VPQDHNPERVKLEAQMVMYLVLQAKITEDQARSLIRDLGLDKNSLLREARAIRRSKSSR
jgi:hypothetical protein